MFLDTAEILQIHGLRFTKEDSQEDEFQPVENMNENTIGANDNLSKKNRRTTISPPKKKSSINNNDSEVSPRKKLKENEAKVKRVNEVKKIEKQKKDSIKDNLEKANVLLGNCTFTFYY